MDDSLRRRDLSEREHEPGGVRERVLVEYGSVCKYCSIDHAVVLGETQF
jgi:hypothetical protein